MTNEVSSLLEDVSEATIRMQGGMDTHLSQGMFIMGEVIEMLNEDKQPIRLPDATVLPVPEGGIPTEQTDILDLTMEAQEVEVMAEKGLGKSTLKVERVCALLDPRPKSLDNSQNRERLCSPQDARPGGLEGAHRDVCGRAHAIACASPGVVGGKPGDNGTRTQEEEPFENGGEACGTCGRCSCW